MSLKQLRFLLRITQTDDIARRYFVVNGFDGTLTMLGLIIGFLISEADNLAIMINACMAVAIALGVSGISSAYISEVAERKRALSDLETAMMTDLTDSAHADAVRWVPLFIGLVNGLAPLLLSLLILIPLFLAHGGFALPFAPLHMAIAIALLLIFLLGMFLGSIAGVSLLRGGIQTLFIALITTILIYLIEG